MALNNPTFSNCNDTLKIIYNPKILTDYESQHVMLSESVNIFGAQSKLSTLLQSETGKLFYATWHYTWVFRVDIN